MADLFNNVLFVSTVVGLGLLGMANYSRIQWKEVVIRTREMGLGTRVTLNVVGILFLIFVLVESISTSNLVNIVIIGKPSLKEYVPKNNSSTMFLFGTAYAQGRQEFVTVLQRQAIRFPREELTNRLAIYVGDIHRKLPNKVVVFKYRRNFDGFVGQDVQVREEVFSEVVSGEIVAEFLLTAGESGEFEFGGRSFTVRVEEISWAVFGSDSMVLSIQKSN